MERSPSVCPHAELVKQLELASVHTEEASSRVRNVNT